MPTLEMASTLTSPIGDHVPPTGKYRGYHVHVSFAGSIVARAQEIIVNVNNNMESYGELGTRHLKWQPGALEVRGSMRQFTFDTLKLRLALGNYFNNPIVMGSGGYVNILNPALPLSPLVPSPAFGTQPWLLPWRFLITFEIHSETTDNYLEYKIDNASIDTWRLQAVTDGDVVENLNFVAETIGVRRF